MLTLEGAVSVVLQLFCSCFQSHIQGTSSICKSVDIGLYLQAAIFIFKIIFVASSLHFSCPR